jgi:hypothetical protein
MSYIYLVGGSKGGVGKTIVTMSLLDYLISVDQKLLLIETDTSNPDVAKAYDQVVATELINLDKRDGWINLINVCSENPEAIVVINTAARNNEGVMANGGTLNGILSELQRELITLWVINRQKDSLLLLKEYMDIMTESTIHVLRNTYFGDEEKFETYQESNIRSTIEKNKGLSLNFPDLADRVSDSLYINRWTIAKALEEMPLGNKAELMRWQSEAKKIFQQIIQ